MIKKAILVTSFLFPLLLYGQVSENLLTGGEVFPKDYLIKVPTERVRNLMVIKVLVGGHTCRFLVDTGAPTVITNKLYNQLKTEKFGSLLVHDQSAIADSVPVVRIKALTIQGVTFSGVSSLVLTTNNLLFDCYEIDGIVGANLLRNCAIEFKQDESCVTITSNPKNLNMSRRNAQKLQLSIQGCPYVWVNVSHENKRQIQALFDTGMDGLFDLNKESHCELRNVKLYKTQAVSVGSSSFGMFGSALADTTHRLLFPTLSFKGLSLNNVRGATTKGNTRVGMELLKYADVTIDFINKRLYVFPKAEKVRDAYEKDIPLDYTYINGKLQVGYVWDSALADSVAVGDHIVEINGVDTRNVDPCKMVRREVVPLNGSNIVITTINKRGETVKLIFKKE